MTPKKIMVSQQPIRMDWEVAFLLAIYYPVPYVSHLPISCVLLAA